MQSIRRVLTGLATVALAGSGFVGVWTTSAVADPEPEFEVLYTTDEMKVIYRADPSVADTEIPAPASPAALKAAATANVIVTYHGFSPQAQTAFQTAIDIWETQLVAPVTITVDAWWEPLGPGVLGQAGPVGFLRGSALPKPNTWYPYALVNQLIGYDYDPSYDDIDASFNSSFPAWYYGIDGNPPAGQYDFVSVVLHELGHGLGFIGSMNGSGTLGSYGFSGYPVVFDHFTEDGAGTNSLSYPNYSTSLGNHLRSNDVWWLGSNAIGANGGSRPKMYAPSVWSSGSSYSHLDEATYPAGDLRSLMTPALSTAEAIHDPGAVTRAMFADLGWTAVAEPVEPPGAPVNASASARPGAAVVGFDPPADDGGAPITQYRVYPDPGGPPVSIGNGSPIVARGLTNGTAYMFRVAAVNSAGEGALSDPSNSITPIAGRYHPVNPVRILDTRTGTGGLGHKLAPGETYELGVEGGPSPIPGGSGVSAVAINATATGGTKYGWVTLFPGDQPLPTVSNLNFVGGQTVPNLATVSVSAAGTIKVNNSGGLAGGPYVHVILDLVGWYDSDGGGAGYSPVSPVRILDTRSGGGDFVGKLAPGQTITVDVTGPGGVPVDHVSGVILNTTATGPTRYGWLTLYPTGEPLPTASNLNFVAGQTVPNLVAVKTGPDGRIRVNNSAGLAGGPHVHVILDVVGWYDDGTVGGAGFTPVAPTRIVDTRSYLGGYGKLGPQQTMSCEVTDVGGVPVSGVSAVIVNTTVTGATRSGWLTLYPTGEPLPTASNLNFVAGQTVPNLAAVKTGPDGEINANNTGGSYAAGWVHVIMDIAGYFDTGV